jgi:uncharacterized membrane protein YfcA
LSPVLAACAVVFAACVQGSIGFAYALLAAPLLALISPALVPGPILLSSLALSALTAWRERASIDRRGVALALAGRVPGAVLAGLAIGWLPAQSYELLFGGIVLLAVLLSLASKGVRATAPALLGAGFASGLMGTLTAVGGPPIALVYQHASGPVLRATLNAYFALGCIVSLGVLALAGRFGQPELTAGIALLPPVALGFLLSTFSRDWIDRGRARAAVLALAGLCSLLVMLKSALA